MNRLFKQEGASLRKDNDSVNAAFIKTIVVERVLYINMITADSQSINID